jgi:hypothetical protein
MRTLMRRSFSCEDVQRGVEVVSRVTATHDVAVGGRPMGRPVVT